jgi:phosphoribosyl-AMP cyclohydrolase / phosphoribosyl-ATP pyrophosphohydrolase
MDKIFRDDDVLLPAIIQDDKTLKVLMLGYMNRESYELSIASGLVTFFSRSRKRLWTKGESSGNYLSIVGIDVDCDQDTLLVRVNPAGPICHTGRVSCFGGRDSEGFTGRLSQIIGERHINLPPGSYTTSLFNSGAERVCKKVAEEAAETIIEAIKGDKKRLVYESADLIYHLIVLLELYGLSLSDIEEELYSRN